MQYLVRDSCCSKWLNLLMLLEIQQLTETYSS